MHRTEQKSERDEKETTAHRKTRYENIIQITTESNEVNKREKKGTTQANQSEKSLAYAKYILNLNPAFVICIRDDEMWLTMKMRATSIPTNRMKKKLHTGIRLISKIE